MSKLARNAPSVTYPVERSGVLGAFLFSVNLLSAGALMAWSFQGIRAGVPWPAFIGWALWLGAAGGALHFWLRQPVGFFRWDGQSWDFAAVGSGGAHEQVWALSGPPGVFLDMQSHLWLHISSAGRRDVWLWLSRSSRPERWMDVRRAVYSRAKPGVDPDAIAPAGSRGA